MTKDPVTNGAGIAAYGLATAMLSTLQAKGYFTKRDVRLIFKTLLSDTQKAGALTFPDGQAAYNLLASLAETAAPSSKPKN